MNKIMWILDPLGYFFLAMGIGVVIIGLVDAFSHHPGRGSLVVLVGLVSSGLGLWLHWVGVGKNKKRLRSSLLSDLIWTLLPPW
jgi:hypothetical protein